jgi:uncharacterized protein YndB with AHSA1/START domain
MSQSITVERSIWIGAAREKVWQAVTDPEQIARWLLPPAMGATMKRDEGGRLLVCMGPMEVPVAVVETMDAPAQATIRSLPDRLIVTAYQLDEEKDGTRLTVTMRGFESLPEETRQERIKPSGEGWEEALANLKACVEGTDQPHPQSYAARLFGYRLEGEGSFAVERSIWIDAPRERVWKAVTDPAEITGWFSPGTVWHLTGLEAGGRLFVRDEKTGGELYAQVVELVDPPHQLVTRSVPVPPETPQVSTWTLVEEKNGTRLTINHSGYVLDPGKTVYGSMEQNAMGFGMVMQNIEAYVMGRELPYPGGF